MGQHEAMVALLLLAALLAAPTPAAADCSRIEMFSRAGCPHCAEAKLHLDRLERARSDLRIEIHDVEHSPEARARLVALAQEHGAGPVAVPAFLVCDHFLVGFSRSAGTGARLEALLGPEARPATVLDVPWLGSVDAAELGLPLFTVVIGLVDGLNPCAIWVLLFLLSILVNLRDRRRVLVVAGVFVVVSGLAYFVFMAAWLNVFLWVGLSRAVQVALGLVAFGVGAVSVRDFFRPEGGATLGIPEAAKPGIYRRVRGIVRAESLWAALAGAIVLAVLVNFVELLCTAGLPALYTQILTLHDLSAAQYYGYLLLYNLAYIFDDTVLVGLAVVGLSHHKLQEREGRWLKLLSGGVMLALGAMLLLRPDWLVRG